MSDAKPVVYFFIGDDELAIKRAVERMEARVRESGAQEMNISRLDGAELRLDDLSQAVLGLPFLAERRLVILTNPFDRLDKGERKKRGKDTNKDRERFFKILEGVPETTALVMVDVDEWEGRDWRKAPQGDSRGRSRHWIWTWLESAGGRAYHQVFRPPDLRSMAGWLVKEARERGGQIGPRAATMIVEQVDNNTLSASQELDKLLAYVDYKREIDEQDVAELAAQRGEAEIFKMLDAMADGDGQLALNLLHRLLEEEDESSLFSMVIRQFRLILVGREMIDEGIPPSNFPRGLATNSFVVDKAMRQARRFSSEAVEGIYRRLLDIDERAKTSQSSLALEMESLVAELVR